MLTPSLETIRLFIHVLAAAVWVGGQVVLAGVVPGLRSVGPDATRAAANGFARVAWPAFGIVFLTGVWNMMEIPDTVTTAFHMTLGIKILLVVVAGASAAVHSRTASRSVLAATGAVGMLASLVALFLGVLLTSPA
jgi:putative copper export protein